MRSKETKSADELPDEDTTSELDDPPLENNIEQS
jgi:hypothetical protein